MVTPEGESLRMSAIQSLAQTMQRCLLQTQPSQFRISSKLLENSFVRLVSDIEDSLRDARYLNVN